MNVFPLRLLKPVTHEGLLREIGDLIHTASADVAAWLVHHGIAEHATAPLPAVTPPAIDPEPEPDEPPALIPSTDTDHTGDDHE